MAKFAIILCTMFLTINTGSAAVLECKPKEAYNCENEGCPPVEPPFNYRIDIDGSTMDVIDQGRKLESGNIKAFQFGGWTYVYWEDEAAFSDKFFKLWDGNRSFLSVSTVGRSTMTEFGDCE